MQMYLNCEAHTSTLVDGIEDSPFDLKKYSRIVDPPPSCAWVFIEEHELSIDDGCFRIGNPWADSNSSPDKTPWVHFRADRHNNGATISFADGHVETHHWRDHYAKWPRVNRRPVNADDRADLNWLLEGIPHSP